MGCSSSDPVCFAVAVEHVRGIVYWVHVCVEMATWLSLRSEVVEDLGTCVPLRFYGDGAEFTSDSDGLYNNAIHCSY